MEMDNKLFKKIENNDPNISQIDSYHKEALSLSTAEL